MNISLDLYKVFYCVAKNKSITGASNELMISQPAVSKSVKTLERQMNSKLFERTNHGIKLTEMGELIYGRVENAISLIDSVEKDVESVLNMELGTLRIGASKVIIDEFLMPYIVKFKDKYPKIEVKIFTENTNILEAYELGLVDIIFTNMPAEIPTKCKFVKLITLHNCFAANENYKQYQGKKLKAIDLERVPLLLLNRGTINRDRIEEYGSNKGIRINPKMEFGSNSVVKEFTLNGFGIGMLDEEHIKKELEDGKLFKLELDIPLKEKYLGMCYNQKSSNLALKEFIKIIDYELKLINTD
ncbi:MAG: LysR family transcriptional regulator [Bacilli bacterium]|nr:LysR family transcriptional regulator [Bacilli bacterium]